eukprot:CAMPEP_0170198544 /NCGR_PEP_ID=MMETSP0040_2-20121228/68836_1 /TAXON_ID=641309 /ORGANISM="Lotharella oceanica, Strain CCMP622" /LENGTH=73 /DNA_ID=CAMNT_0010448551 /DNA_START=147 /DNA_END=368 /DNA_ORIENTATION=+
MSERNADGNTPANHVGEAKAINPKEAKKAEEPHKGENPKTSATAVAAEQPLMAIGCPSFAAGPISLNIITIEF